MVQARAWHIFMLTFGLFLIYDLCFDLFSNDIHTYLLGKNIAGVVCSFFVLAWIWGVRNALQDKISVSLRQYNLLFRLFFVFVCVYLLSMEFYFLIYGVFPQSLTLLICHLLAILFLAGAMLLLSRDLVLAESNKRPIAEEYFRVFVLILIFPIGIWFIQKRINRLFL